MEHRDRSVARLSKLDVRISNAETKRRTFSPFGNGEEAASGWDVDLHVNEGLDHRRNAGGPKASLCTNARIHDDHECERSVAKSGWLSTLASPQPEGERSYICPTLIPAPGFKCYIRSCLIHEPKWLRNVCHTSFVSLVLLLRCIPCSVLPATLEVQNCILSRFDTHVSAEYLDTGFRCSSVSYLLHICNFYFSWSSEVSPLRWPAVTFELRNKTFRAVSFRALE